MAHRRMRKGFASNVRSRCLCWAFTDKRRLVFSWQENAALFKADLSSQTWVAYVGHIDRIVLDGLCRLVHKSLQLLLTNMAPDVGPGVLAVGVPVLGSGCPTAHAQFGQWPNMTVPMLPAACRAVGHEAPHQALTCFRPRCPRCSRCRWTYARAGCSTSPHWRWGAATASWCWWRGCSGTRRRWQPPCHGCWRGRSVTR